MSFAILESEVETVKTVENGGETDGKSLENGEESVGNGGANDD